MVVALDSERGPARLWYWGWSGFYGAVIVGQLVIVATSSNNGSVENGHVNVVTSLFGLLSTLVTPPPVMYELGPIQAMPEGTEAERASKAAAIRELFDREASKEHFYHSPWNHILGLAVNAGVCAYLYWGLHLGGRALLNLVAGSVIWEANIFTSPNAANRLASELQGKTPVQVQVIPILPVGGAAGLALVGSF